MWAVTHGDKPLPDLHHLIPRGLLGPNLEESLIKLVTFGHRGFLDELSLIGIMSLVAWIAQYMHMSAKVRVIAVALWLGSVVVMVHDHKEGFWLSLIAGAIGAAFFAWSCRPRQSVVYRTTYVPVVVHRGWFY